MSSDIPLAPAIVTPSENDSRIAQESSDLLSRLLESGSPDLAVDIRSSGKATDTVPIPASACRILAVILSEMANGNTITFIPDQTELTTQQAAKLLNVSRPFLIGLLEGGKIPYRKAGTHRRVRFHDLMAYKQKSDKEHLQSLAELTSQAQEQDMDY